MTNANIGDWIKVLNPDPNNHLRLFCFPFSGGGASFFRSWQDFLPLDVEICTVQMPGRENRFKEEPFIHMRSVLQKMVQVLDLYQELPFAFLGHSLGGLISYELALQLRKQNRATPVHLFVSSCRAPHLPEIHPPLHRLPRDEFIESLRRYNGTPDEVLNNPDLMEIFLPVLRADFSILETYQYQEEEPLDCPVSVLGGVKDNNAPYEDLIAWEKYTRCDFKVRMYPGGHFYLKEKSLQFFTDINWDLQKCL